MIRQTISQKLSQKLLPKLILNQNILAIPTLALDNIIKKELEENPMLEEEGLQEDEMSDEVQVRDEQTSEASEEAVSSEQDDAGGSETGTETETEPETSPEEKRENEFDWEEYFETESEDQRVYDKDQANRYDMNYLSESTASIKDSLVLQLHLSPLSEKMIFIGDELIWSLSDEGFFNDEPEDILRDLDVKKAGTQFSDETFTIEELNETLEYIQQKFDPAGIGARNLRESLLIQTKRLPIDSEMKDLTCKVISEYLEDLRQRRYEKISKELGIELKKVKEVFDIIQKLDPRPGFSDETSSNSYIVPDLVVKKIDDKYEVYLNDKYIPNLRISRAYKNLYSDRKSNLDKDTKEYIVNNFNRAKWFIEAINSRRETLLKIMDAILIRQREYFDDNETGLKPMFEKEIGEDIKMDTSTVSRAVRGKYVQTDFGIFELRSFFTTSLATNDGQEVSNTEAKNRLKQIIDAEDKSKPLTDEDLGIEMNKLGFKIARRTIAKYRESMNIPVAKLRRLITD